MSAPHALGPDIRQDDGPIRSIAVIDARHDALAGILGVLAAFAVGAQEPTSAENSDRVVYAAAFYAQFAPRTALDMVRQTPGFVLQTGDGERRGFSGAVGNVLIDGERLSAKSQSLEGVLGR